MPDEATAPAPARMRAPTMRKLVKDRFGQAFNSGLVYAKVDEMQHVLEGTLKPDVLSRRLKSRARLRQRQGRGIPGRRKRQQAPAEVAGPINGHAEPTRVKRKYTRRAVVRPVKAGRKAASPIPPDAGALRASSANIEATLGLAYLMSAIPTVLTAPAHTLRAAIEAILSSRGMP